MNLINLYAIIIALNSSVVRAHNSAVKVNESVTLVCNETYTRGLFYPAGVESSMNSGVIKRDFDKTVLNNQSFRLIWSNSTISLTILSVQKNQAGMYVCMDPRQSAAVISNVIVLGKRWHYRHNNKFDIANRPSSA